MNAQVWGSRADYRRSSMIDNVSSIGSGAPHAPLPPVRASASEQTAPATQSTSDASLATPPAEVLNALDSAQRVLADLHSRKLDLRYDVDPETKRVRAQIVCADGNAVREIPVQHALDLLSGGVDAVG
jgi:hypothetical protein